MGGVSLLLKLGARENMGGGILDLIGGANRRSLRCKAFFFLARLDFEVFLEAELYSVYTLTYLI